MLDSYKTFGFNQEDFQGLSAYVNELQTKGIHFVPTVVRTCKAIIQKNRQSDTLSHIYVLCCREANHIQFIVISFATVTFTISGCFKSF